MCILEDCVYSVISDFIKNNVLFTALDVSNKVKETMPLTRHKAVRDIVRNCWLSDIEPFNYGRTPINVTLNDGTVVEALLYHPIADAWDLDQKYDDQKRSQTSVIPNDNLIAKTDDIATIVKDHQSISDNAAKLVKYAAINPNDLSQKLKHISNDTMAVQTPTNGIDLWDNLFKSQPSLFPRQ